MRNSWMKKMNFPNRILELHVNQASVLQVRYIVPKFEIKMHLQKTFPPPVKNNGSPVFYMNPPKVAISG